MGLNYVLFFVGSVIISVIIFAIRERDNGRVKDIGLVVIPNPVADEYNVLNLTQAIQTGVLPRNAN